MRRPIDLGRYGTAGQRVRAFYRRFPDGAIQTELVRLDPDLIIFRARVFRDRADPVPTTGWAYDRPGADPDGEQTARILAACEAAAVGRALANLGLAGPLRPCREEMEKVARLLRHSTPAPRREPAANPDAGAPTTPAGRIRALLASLRLPAHRRHRIEVLLAEGMTDREAHEIEAYLLALRSRTAARRTGVDARASRG